MSQHLKEILEDLTVMATVIENGNPAGTALSNVLASNPDEIRSLIEGCIRECTLEAITAESADSKKLIALKDDFHNVWHRIDPVGHHKFCTDLEVAENKRFSYSPMAQLTNEEFAERNYTVNDILEEMKVVILSISSDIHTQESLGGTTLPLEQARRETLLRLGELMGMDVVINKEPEDRVLDLKVDNVWKGNIDRIDDFVRSAIRRIEERDQIQRTEAARLEKHDSSSDVAITCLDLIAPDDNDVEHLPSKVTYDGTRGSKRVPKEAITTIFGSPELTEQTVEFCSLLILARLFPPKTVILDPSTNEGKNDERVRELQDILWVALAKGDMTKNMDPAMHALSKVIEEKINWQAAHGGVVLVNRHDSLFYLVEKQDDELVYHTLTPEQARAWLIDKGKLSSPEAEFDREIETTRAGGSTTGSAEAREYRSTWRSRVGETGTPPDTRKGIVPSRRIPDF